MILQSNDLEEQWSLSDYQIKVLAIVSGSEKLRIRSFGSAPRSSCTSSGWLLYREKKERVALHTLPSSYFADGLAFYGWVEVFVVVLGSSKQRRQQSSAYWWENLGRRNHRFSKGFVTPHSANAGFGAIPCRH